MRKIYNDIPDLAKNKFLLTGLIFVIWITFFDSYNFIWHYELMDKKEQYEQELFRLKKETAKNKQFIQKLNNPAFAEKYAREKFLLKKEGEDIFIIE